MREGEAMSELQVLKDAVSANMGRLLHGSLSDAEDAVDAVMSIVDGPALYGTFCGLLATVAGDALKATRASFPPGPARDAPFGMLADPGMDLPSRTAAQMITAAANDDQQMVLALLRAAISWEAVDPMAKLVARLSVHARVMHQAVCDDVTADGEGGA